MCVLMYVCMYAQPKFKECLILRLSDISVYKIENVGVAWGRGYLKARPTVFHIAILLS